MLGFNFRMPEMMGAMGSVQLRKLGEALRIRRSIARRYSQAFSEIEAIIMPREEIFTSWEKPSQDDLVLPAMKHLSRISSDPSPCGY